MSDAKGPAADHDAAPRGGAPGPLLLLARAAVLWERIWRAFWPAVSLAAAFLAMALLDWLPMLPTWLHGVLLVAFGAFEAWLVRRGWTRVRAVGPVEARRRLETDSGLTHRPLSAIDDSLAVGADDAVARALWIRHRERALAATRRLILRLPSPGLARLDPYGIRAAALLFLVIGLAAGRGDAALRLQRALTPADPAVARNLVLEVWITPPAYTREAPIFLRRAAAKKDAAADAANPADAATVVVPAGSTILAHAGGIDKTPKLKIGDREVPFQALAATAAGPGEPRAHAFRAEDTIEGGTRLAVEESGRVLAEWPLDVVVDRPPTAAFLIAPSRAGRANLKIDFEATDDYAVVGVEAIVRHAEGRAIPGGGKEIRLALPSVGVGTAKADGSSLHDLTAHPWAGVGVTVQLEAVDGRGQKGLSDAVQTVLPERIFNHPVARALVEQRKRLATATPETVADVVRAIDDISTRPMHFANDTVVFLALRVARGRLALDGGDAAVAQVQKILWDTALRIEDGKFAVAEKELRDIQERLANALKDGKKASPEFEKLLDELRQAMDKFLQALQEQMANQGNDQQAQPFDPKTMRMVDSSDLHRMIEEARELARSGQMDAAKRMLAELQRMLQALQQGMQAGQPNPEAQRAKKMMDDLRELSRRQQQLLDRSFKRSQQQGAMPGQRPGGEEGKRGGRQPGGEGEREFDEAGAQNALRKMLGNLMRRMDEMMGKIPDPMGKAERAMRDAEGALGDDDPGRAVPSQTDAVNQLRKAIEGVGEQMARRFGNSPGGPGQMPLGERDRGSDPFGRQPNGAYGNALDGDVKVPTAGERRRAREILNELRRRSGERDRPTIEREYIDRLLRQF